MKQNTHKRLASCVTTLGLALSLAQPDCALAARGGAGVSESDYLRDVPTVISVSRLAQTLEDTPGAVTLIDRSFIRMSGARDVVDLLRLVPGFQTSSAVETDAPMATYHGRNIDWANRIQVLVDGRSVYSGLLEGSAGMGWQTLALDDIERIEILRGSNSASYGARAFLGVVNIVSRDVRETVGWSLSHAQGNNGILDGGMRLGWSQGNASFRLSVDRTGDDGLRGAFGRSSTERLNLASHLSLDGGAELELRAGEVSLYAGRGDPTDTAGNPGRRWVLGAQYLQADWRKPLDDTQDLLISASHSHNSARDRFLFMTHTGTPDYFGAKVDFGGDEYISTLTLQHTQRHSPELRSVWGTELRHEETVSPNSFDLLGPIFTRYVRLFGNAEWHLSERLLLNAGALAEHSNIGGESISPRLMLNWRAAPGHTLRAGASTAFRPPSAYERYGRVQYYDANGQNPTGYYVFNNSKLRPERLLSQELGYYFATPETKFSGDVRVFQEQIIDGISPTEDLVIPGSNPRTNFNGLDYTLRGVELQLNWEPTAGTRLQLGQNWTQIQLADSAPGPIYRFRTEHGAPRYAASLVLMQTLGHGLQATLSHQLYDDMALMSISDRKWLFSMQRTDLRLAKEWRLGSYRAELAAAFQNLAEPYQDGDWKFRFHHRALVSLKLEH